MNKHFFVLLNNQKGTRLIPLLEPETEELAMFASYDLAKCAAEATIFGANFGFYVYDAEDAL